MGLVETHGWDAVTVDQIAARAKTGVASVYRNFGTKERVVLWDDYDPMLLEAIGERLATARPLAAVQGALVATLDRVYRDDRERILRRSRLVFSVPALLLASQADQRALSVALASMFEAAIPDVLTREIAAAAVVATLEVAIRRWTEQDGRRPMRAVLAQAFEALATITRA